MEGKRSPKDSIKLDHSNFYDLIKGVLLIERKTKPKSYSYIELTLSLSSVHIAYKTFSLIFTFNNPCSSLWFLA